MSSTSTSPETRDFDGYETVWQRWYPTAGIPLRGALFFIHGQGDYAERYQEISRVFTDEGYAFLTCDLPGHGLAPGRRGHIPSFSLVERVTAHALQEARTLAPAPHQLIGLCGHSVGGLLALAMLQRLEEAPDFSWISSPLLRAEAGQPAWKSSLLRPVSHLCPTLTLSTGVTAEMCRNYLPGETDHDHLLFHNRISLSWGRTLIDLGQEVRTQPERIPARTQLYLTQGGLDRVCPPQYWEAFVQNLPQERLHSQLYPEARHEPFADDAKDELLAALGAWLRGLEKQ